MRDGERKLRACRARKIDMEVVGNGEQLVNEVDSLKGSEFEASRMTPSFRGRAVVKANAG